MTIVRLVADPYPPYQYVEAGAIEGIDFETISHVFQGLPFDLDIGLHAWDECLRRVNSGEADGIFQISKTPQREIHYLFSDLLRTEETALFTRGQALADRDFSVLTAEAIGTHVLGVLDGYSYSPSIDAIPGESRFVVAQQGDLLRALCAGSCDLILMDTGVAAFLANKLKVNIRQVVGFSLKRDLYVAFRLGCESIVEAFNQQRAKESASSH